MLNFGKWKHESSFEEAKFLRQKCYVEKFENEYNITCSGLPKKCMYKKDDSGILYYKTYEEDPNGKFQEVEKSFNIEDFKIGFSATGKLTFKHVVGGVKLVETEFSIKNNLNLFKF